MGRNAIFRKIAMDNINQDLALLEQLSKKISDLIYKNDFSTVPILDATRRQIIKKIQNNSIYSQDLKRSVSNLIKENHKNISKSEVKINELKKNHNKFNKRLKAYFLNK